MRQLAIFVAIIIGILAALWGGDALMDRSISVVVEGEAPLYALPPQDYPASNPQIGTLKPGDSAKVTRSGYGKDFQAVRVETASGQTGWVVLGTGVRLVS